VSLLAALSLQAAGQGARGPTPVRIGVVLDGPSDFTDSLRSQFAREIVAFFGAERTVDLPSTATLRGDWTAAGASAAIDRLLADPAVDIGLTLGSRRS